MRLLGVVGVPKDDRIRCEHEDCDRPVYRRIHVIDTGNGLRLIGGTCYKEYYLGRVDEAGAWHVGGDGYPLTPEERERLKQNTESLRATLEQRYAEYLAHQEQEEQAKAQTHADLVPGQQAMEFDAADRMPADAGGHKPPAESKQGLSEYERWAIQHLEPGRCVHPGALPASQDNINDRDILAFAYFIERSAAELFGIDPDLPGWIGMVKMKAVSRFRLMAQARKAGLPDWRKAGGVSSFAQMANARAAGQAGWWQAHR